MGTTNRRDWTPYVLVILGWVATRALAVIAVDLTPWIVDDVRLYDEWLGPLEQGTFPADDPRWQYPPGIAPVFRAFGALPWDARWSWTAVILAVDAALLAALLIAKARGEDARWAGPWLWAAAGLVVGPIMVTRFDTVPTLFAVIAILLAGRAVWSGAAAGIGLTVKVWPALMLFVLPRRQLPRGILGLVVAAGAVLVTFTLTTQGSLSFLANQQSRGLQVESVGALPYLLHDLAGGDVAYGYVYGSFQVLMEGAETVGLIATLTGLALYALLAWRRLCGRLEEVPPGDVALTVMLVAVASSRVYSPQFNVWLIGIAAAALVAPNCRIRVPIIIMVAVSVITQVVYPWSGTQLINGGPSAIIPQAIVVIGLLTAMVMSLVAILRRTKEAA